MGPAPRAPETGPAERRAAALGFAWFFALLAAYYLLRPIREEMGIRGGVGALHWTFTATFAVLVLAVPLSAALFARVPRVRAVPLVYRFFLLNLLAFAAAFSSGAAPAAVARAFFVWLSVFNLLVVTVFWSVMADLFTAAEGRRLFGRVAAGGSLGAIAGSAAAGLLVGPLGFGGLVLLAAALLEVAARCAVALSRAAAAAAPRGDAGAGAGPGAGPRDRAAAEGTPVGGTALSGVAAVLRSPYLLALSGQLLLYTFAGTFLYFQQARIVSEAIPDPARRTALFAAFDLAVNVGAFALQAFATGPVAAAFGLAPALAVVPLLSGGGFLALAAAPTLLVLGGVQVLRRIGHYAFERPGRDVLFTVIPREQKYKSKGFIDTVVYRGGDALAAWIQAGLAAAGLATRELALAGVPLAAASLGLALWLAARERRLEEGGAPSPSPRLAGQKRWGDRP